MSTVCKYYCGLSTITMVVIIVFIIFFIKLVYDSQKFVTPPHLLLNKKERFTILQELAVCLFLSKSLNTCPLFIPVSTHCLYKIYCHLLKIIHRSNRNIHSVIYIFILNLCFVICKFVYIELSMMKSIN